MSPDEDFLKSEFSWGVILRTDLETIAEVKEFLSDHDVRVIYQTTSADRLYIIRENERGGKHVRS